ncbi:hypothetical protein L13192_04829 [Pyrenophora tritici-repentis]|nr:hypothetical protein L13192_04829 [Pyrenophora tritici-repentis]
MSHFMMITAGSTACLDALWDSGWQATVFGGDLPSFMDKLLEDTHPMLAVADFCRQHEHVKVRYESRKFLVPSPIGMVLCGLFLKFAIRRKDLRSVAFIEGSPCGIRFEQWAHGTEGTAKLNVENLRYDFHCCPSDYDEIEDIHKQRRYLRETVCADLAKEWYEYGI